MATAAIPPAFVAELIDDVGAYAGIAAIVGLAVLSLLYFTQAREVKRLREWASRAPERDAELAARVRGEGMPMRPRTPGVPPAPGARPPAGNGQQTTRPVQPPGVPAAPAAGAGARAAEGGQQAVGPAGQPQQPGQPPAESATGQATGQGERSGQPPTGLPAPATAAGKPRSPEAAFAQARGANPVGGPPPPHPPGDQDAKRRQAVRPTAAAAAGGRGGATDPSGQRAAALRRPDASSRALPPRGPRSGMPPPPPVAGDGQGRGARTTALIVAGGLAALVAGVLLITQIFGGGDDDRRAASPSNSATPAQAPPEREGPPPRGEVNVAVLNGTTVNGLAETIADELEESGFQRGETATNTADQTLSATTVQFAQGSRESALEVAEVLGVGEEGVERLERNTRVTAGEEAAVVVLVGNDGVGNPAGAGAPEGTGSADGTVAP